MEIPSKEQWGDLSDLERAYAYERFFGKSNDEMQTEYKRSIVARCFDFYEMPIDVFVYYVYGLASFIESNNSQDLFNITYAINCLFGLFTVKSAENPREVNKIFPDFYPLLKYISDNQELYDMDEDIYGLLKEELDKIQNNLQK